jgi:hydrogenase maturation protein HypF
LKKSVREPLVRKHIELSGILQGIGCRPTIYRLAVSLGLGGWVKNTSQGVLIEIEGPSDDCNAFSRELVRVIPASGRIDSLVQCHVDPIGDTLFQILQSAPGNRSITPIPPDVAICPDCLREMLNPDDPRYLYPFTTCTICGPRFTVVRSFPYDRDTTSMADFSMCPRCLAEYNNPADRRFHSQTNSCPQCGPALALTDNRGCPLPGDPIAETLRLIREGKIIAVKGLGGFHLACDALNESAVQELRNRKGRAEKPFAVMMAGLETVTEYCRVSPKEAKLLLSPVAPIVLLQSRGDSLAPSVAPFINTLGVMLPYTPLHHLLFHHPHTKNSDRPRALVMTSGNRSEEPIAASNHEALERLQDLVDAFLLHNRDIVLRADDSIFRLINGNPTVFRRSRGLVPLEFSADEADATPIHRENNSETLPSGGSCQAHTGAVIIGAGGDIKNCPAILVGDRIVPGPHVGDLASPVGCEYFARSMETLSDYLEARPSIAAVDPHPAYHSSSLALQWGSEVHHVFHHHAHCVSLLVEHQRKAPTLFAVFDGTGYGPDGTIWGGEFFLADRKHFERLAYLSIYPLPGGEAAIREPLRILAALLVGDNGMPPEFMPLFRTREHECALWLETARKGLNSPMTSSAGRLFDAVAAAAGFVRPVTFEGQAAMWLEGICDEAETASYEVPIRDTIPVQVDSRHLAFQVAHDVLSGTPPYLIAAKFHNSMAAAILETVIRVSEKTGIRHVGLTGGCFQNKILAEKTARLLSEQEFTVLLHGAVPPNDGGLAIGQCAAAREMATRNYAQ